MILNVNFYSGGQTIVGDSSFLMELLVTFIGSLLALLIALFIFYREQKATRIKEETKNRELKKAELKYFIELLKANQTHVGEQIERVNIYTNSQRTSLTELKLIGRIANQNFKRLYAIQSKNIFEAWIVFVGIDDQSILQLNRLNSTLDYLEGLLDELFRIFHIHNNESLDQLRAIKHIIEHVVDDMSILKETESIKLGKDKTQDDYYNFLKRSIQQFDELIDQKANFDKINSDLLRGLIKGFLAFKDKPESLRIVVLVRNARVRLNEVKKDISNFCEEADRISAEMVNSVNKLDEKIKLIENKIS